MANEQNLIPFGDPRLAESVQREIQSKGGKARAEIQARKRELQEEWFNILDMPLKPGELQKIKSLADTKNANMNLDTTMKMRIVQEVIKRGDINMYIKILSLAGLLGPDEPEEVTKEEQQDNAFLKALNESAKEVWEDEQTNEEG